MSDEDRELALLNIYEVETEEGPRHFIGFLDPVGAGAEGIASRCLVGEFQPGPEGEFDVDSFEVNPEFVEAFTGYMNGDPSRSAEVTEAAKDVAGQWLYIVDPRADNDHDVEPAPAEVVGAFAVDETGQVVPNSFQYNANHRWFHLESGVSGLLEDRRFYDWLHRT